MKILHLTLKKKWFDMVASGEKKEEYREPTEWIRSRLFTQNGTPKEYDAVCFRHGYALNAPRTITEYLGAKMGQAKPEWSDNWQGEVFVIKLGNIINPQ